MSADGTTGVAAAPNGKRQRTTAVNHGRDALVEAAIRSIAVEGAARTHPKDLAESLGLSKSLVNFHFGGRDGLLAEAIATSYERYVDLVWAAAESAGSDPVARLFAWIDEQIDWTAANPGLAAALNFPSEASSLQGRFDEETRERLRVAGMRNFRNLLSLVDAARTALRDPSQPPLEMEIVEYDAAIIGWLTLGSSVWNAGRHIPTNSPETAARFGPARERLKERILGMLRGD